MSVVDRNPPKSDLAEVIMKSPPSSPLSRSNRGRGNCRILTKDPKKKVYDAHPMGTRDRAQRWQRDRRVMTMFGRSEGRDRLRNSERTRDGGFDCVYEVFHDRFN